MAAGQQVTRQIIDNAAASLVFQLENTLDRIVKFQAYLSAQASPGFDNTYGYSTQDVADLKSAYLDLKKLADIYKGLQTQATTYDFRTFASRLEGIGL